MKETNESVLNKLKETDPQAYKSALLILKEYKEKGHSEIYNKLLYSDYKEIPVTINEFITNKTYLGNGVIDKEGNQTIFPYWIKVLNDIFPNNLDTAYNTLVLTGAIGLGKSFIAVICILYLLYRMLCLKNARYHYGLQEIDVITFSFINITMEAAKGVAWSKCQELLQASPWFMAHGTITKNISPEWQPKQESKIELLYGSLPRHVIGRCVFASFEDEISFQPNQDVGKQKDKAMKLISSVDARMQSRFMKGEVLPTLNILASSKRTEQSFLESYIDMKKQNESKTTLVIDEPQWVIRTDKNSKNKFYVAVGNKFLNNEVLPLNITPQDLQAYKDKGYMLMQVPMGYYEKFLDDIDIALTDIAGISTSSTTKYISGARWSECRKDNLINPMSKEIIEVGNAQNDTTQYYDFFDLEKVDTQLMNRPLYIHLDMSVSGDRTGIAGIWIRGKEHHQEGVLDSKELHYQLVFSFAVQAPKGYQISFEKNRQFIYRLKEKGFNIKGVSTDSFQSADLGQALLAKGYNYKMLSVDRVDAESKICLPYQYFKSTIYEHRLIVYKTDKLVDEIIGLERNGNGRIDHPMGGTVGSKDIADAICGSIWNASQNAAQFAYDFGENLDAIIETNKNDINNNKEQLTLDFTEELKKIHDNVLDVHNDAKTNNKQKEEDISNIYASQGIFLW